MVRAPDAAAIPVLTGGQTAAPGIAVIILQYQARAVNNEMKSSELLRLKKLESEIRCNCRKLYVTYTMMQPETLEKKPFILDGSGIRNWNKKSHAERLAIIEGYYKAREGKAIKKLRELAELPETLDSFKARVEWNASRVWGYNPTAETWTGCDSYGIGRASGCGYDKLSAAIQSSLSNKSAELLTSAVIKKHIETGEAFPYGVRVWDNGVTVNFSGCGVSALIKILEYCGLKARHISGKMFDYIETI